MANHYNFNSVDEHITEFQEGDENLYDNFKTAAEALRDAVTQMPMPIPNFRRGLILVALAYFTGGVGEEQFQEAFSGELYNDFRQSVGAYKELIETLYGDNDIYLEGAHALIAKQAEAFPMVEEQPVAQQAPANQPPQPGQPGQQIGGRKRRATRKRKTHRKRRASRRS